jgi:hypothetical protein
MADPQERLQKIASVFGDSDISIFYKRDKVYPDRPVSEETVDKIEAALRSPEGEQSSLRVTQGKEVLYRSYQGAVTKDVKGIALDFQTAIKSPEQAQYYELLNGRLESVGETPYTPQALRAEINQEMQHVQGYKDIGNSFDEMVVRGAADKGLTREATQKILDESPAFEAFLKSKPDEAAIEKYRAPVNQELERVFAPQQNQEQAQSVEQSMPQPELSSVVNPDQMKVPQTAQEQVQAAIEPKLAEQLRQQAPIQAERGGEIVLAQSKALIPLEPTLQQLNEKMPEILSPQPVTVSKAEPVDSTPQAVAAKPEPVASAPNESLEKALAAANSRLDALQTQLSSTQKALEDLSKHVKESNLKTWATNTAQKVGTTIQAIAVQAKTKVVDWVTQAKATVGQKATQVKTAAQNTVGNVKTAAQEKVERVKTTTQLKTIEVRETARHRINDVLSPVDSAALTATANRVISEWGKDGKFEGNTFNFQRSQSGDVSIHTKDGAAVFANGVVTDKASPQTIAHLSQLPRRMGVVENHTPTPTPTFKKEFAR